MILLNIAKATATALAREPLTSGMSAAVEVGFGFSPDWLGLSKTAVFTNGRTTVDVLESQWSAQGTVPIPHEVLSEAGRRVMVGIYGTDGERVVLPTVWAELGVVLPGADPSGDESTDPSLPVWAQLQAEIESGGGGGGITPDEAIDALAETGYIAPVTDEAGRLYADENGKIYSAI